MSEGRSEAGVGWHADKRVQVGHIVATLVAAVSALGFIFALRADVDALKADREAQNRRDELQDATSLRDKAEVRAYLSRIEDKLDRVIERQINGGKR